MKLSPVDPSLVAGKKWSALLASLHAEGTYVIDLPFWRDIYSITVTASRFNSEPNRDRKYSCRTDKINSRIAITVTRRQYV